MKRIAAVGNIAALAILVLGGEAAAGFDMSATRTVTVDDPALNMLAFKLEIPKGWRFTGMISRPGGCHGPAVPADGLTFTALAPDGITAIEKLPGVQWSWASEGAPADRKCAPVAIGSALGFLLNIAVPNLRPDAKNVSVLALPEKMQQGLQEANQQLRAQGNGITHQSVDAARVRLSYTLKGHAVEEMLGATVSCLETDFPAYPAMHRPATQRHVCHATGVNIRRAPQGRLDALIAENLPPPQIDPQWDAQIQQRMQSQFAAWRTENDKLFKSIQRHFDQVTGDMLERGREFQNAQKQSFDNAMAQDRATQGAIDHAAQMQVRDSLNRQLFVDPTTGKRIETSNQYGHNWISGDGQSVVLNDDPTFDPNGVVDPVRQSWTELIPVN